jgi:hypothetical protein
MLFEYEIYQIYKLNKEKALAGLHFWMVHILRTLQGYFILVLIYSKVCWHCAMPSLSPVAVN